MTRAWRCLRSTRPKTATRCFTSTARRHEVRSLAELPHRLDPGFRETSNHDLLSLQWPTPPRNVLLIPKAEDAPVRTALLEFADHIHATYPDVSLCFEPAVAGDIGSELGFDIYTPQPDCNTHYNDKIDLTTTLGGDGTILHAASLFATAKSVPPVLSFSMGTLGFLGEWKFSEYKRAFREVYVSGAPSPLTPRAEDERTVSDSGSGPRDTKDAGWSSVRGKTMGTARSSRILLRNRLRVGIFSDEGERLPHEPPFAHQDSRCEDIFALNEVLLHRGALPHLAHITILIGSGPQQKVLTTAIADGFLVSTPTGSTAYSLSSGGSIVHPLVSSILLTPICPRSLSFRPLVLPANTPITLRIDAENRSKEVEVSIDGVRRKQGLRAGMEVRVVGEEVRTAGAPGSRDWIGGVPSIVRSGGAADGDDHWVGGLNSLLKFNYPFGEHG